MESPGKSTNQEPSENSRKNGKQASLVSADRLKAIADGVFAVAMTLLVLELVVPEISEPSSGELGKAVLSMWPKFVAYVLSFLIAGIFWLIHHTIFDAIRYYDSTLAWINVLFLLLVALIPFTTSLLGEYFLQRTSTVIYGVHLLFMFVGGYSLWTYSTWKHILLVPGIDPHVARGGRRMGYVYFSVLIIAILIAFFSPLITVIIYGLFVLTILIFTGIGRTDHAFSIPVSRKDT